MSEISQDENQISEQERHEQFVALFVRHEPAIHSFVLSLLPDLGLAEDIMQQVSMTMWRRFDQFELGTSFRNWAFQIAKYQTMNTVSKMRRDRHIFSEKVVELLAVEATKKSEELDAQQSALAGCLERLSDEQRGTLAGCYQEDSTIKEFAESVGCTPNQVYKKLNRIRAVLQKCVQHRLGLEA